MVLFEPHQGLCNPKGVFMLRRNILLTSLAVLIPNFVLASEQTKTLKIGVTAGLHAQILEQVLPIAKKNGLNIKIVEFQDYVQPNAALAAGDLDVNIFQTKPFLDAANRDRAMTSYQSAKL